MIMMPDAKVISKFSVKPMYIIGIGAKRQFNYSVEHLI